MGNFTIRVVLTVKHDTREEAQAEINQRLNQWFAEDTGKQAPYPSGSLLFYSFTPKKGD